VGGTVRRTVQVTALVAGVVTALTLVVAAAGGPRGAHPRASSM